MKLFIDSTNSFFILATINKNNKVSNFSMIKTNNNIVKNFILWIDKFLKDNKINIKNIDGIMTTIGPGSFTGSKVSIGFLKTYNFLYEFKTIEVIDTFNLLKQNNKKYVAIKFGKNKFYVKKFSNFSFSKIKIVDDLSLYNKNLITIHYEGFSSNHLENLIIKNKFKLINDINKLKIKYLTKY